MRFLIDNSISQAIAVALREHGHDAAHVREFGMETASDESILRRALDEDRAVIAYDLDFPRLLALRRQSKPSLIIFRRIRQPRDQIATLIRNLNRLERDLSNGCVVVFEPDRIRVRDLPVGRSRP